jgi:hypothetical protein
MTDQEKFLQLHQAWINGNSTTTALEIERFYQLHFPGEKDCGCGNKIGRMMTQLRKKLMSNSNV